MTTPFKPAMLLAGDIGGTNTRLGLFEHHAHRARRLAVGIFPTAAYPDLPAIISAFACEQDLKDVAIHAACFGVAGPVVEQSAKLTNVPWRVTAAEVADRFGIGRVRLLNDLEAMACALPVLEASELQSLQDGTPTSGGNMALIAAGTGLGQSILHRVDSGFVPMATEAGHANFAARTEPEMRLVRDLTARFGCAEIEHVLSGAGLRNLHRIVHAQPCPATADLDDAAMPAAISTAALKGTCRSCAETLDMFLDAYGAEAGNLALRSLATAGVFVGGGIAPKILPALANGRFISAFRDKRPPYFRDLLMSIPVNVILNDEAGLLGAAVHAATL